MKHVGVQCSNSRVETNPSYPVAHARSQLYYHRDDLSCKVYFTKDAYLYFIIF
jgi:hypothetical protein